jgi:hypothetical protein
VKPAIVSPRQLAALVAAALALSTVLAAPPQTVYRCGPDGRSYSQTPCADGRPVNAEDPRSASQQKAARGVADHESQQAQKMAEERRQREAAAKGQAAAGFKSAPAVDAASAPSRKAKTKAAKTAAADNPPGVMSPPMRAPAQTSASK